MFLRTHYFFENLSKAMVFEELCKYFTTVYTLPLLTCFREDSFIYLQNGLSIYIYLYIARPSPSKRFIFIYFNGSPLKVTTNDFYFMIKTIFVLEIFAFLSWLFGYVEKRLEKKAMGIFKIYGATDWTTNNYNHLLPNTSK